MENTEIRLRIATREDAAMVADLARRTFYETFAPSNTEENMRIYLEEQFPRERQMEQVGTPGSTFILAMLGDEAVGFASLRESEPPQGLKGERAIEIGQLYSDKRYIGKGVGAALMQACIDLARQRSKEWIWLGVWSQNHRAKAFYSKWGFERFGEYLFILGLDAQTDWWMRRKL